MGTLPYRVITGELQTSQNICFMEQDYFGEGAIKRVRGSEAHLASTFQGGSCCACQELIQLHGHFSVICQIKVAKGSLSGIRWSLTRNWLSQLINSHHTFRFKMPPLCTTLDGPKFAWEVSCRRAGPGPLTQPWGTSCLHCAGYEVFAAQLQQPPDDPRQQKRLRRGGQMGWESDQQSQLPKASEIRTRKLSTFSLAAQVYTS